MEGNEKLSFCWQRLSEEKTDEYCEKPMKEKWNLLRGRKREASRQEGLKEEF